ncbi:hypothetical protein [Pendulispora albinea]|uniref:Uncharacterized protein n=1 Tax=Pendulispora albinea TaxID=2741071 RepID=A0ABZ2LRH9_9BACT
MSWFHRLARSTEGTMTLTFSQLFMGALTIGLGSFRGTEAYLTFYYETQVGHANYAASKLGADHARASNSNSNNNVISASIMGPRFAVEADNITMDVNAAIACPQWHNSHMRKICSEYMANKPRALAKLVWVRAKQEFLWGALGKLTTTIDKVTSLDAMEQVRSTTTDRNVSLRAEDPSTSGNIWGTDNTPVSCTLAQKDALPTEMPGHAFPILMENLLQELPRTLVATLPKVICGAMKEGQSLASLGGSGSGSGSNSENIKLPQIPSISKDTQKQCNEIQERMQAQIQHAHMQFASENGGYDNRTYLGDRGSGRGVKRNEESKKDESPSSPVFSSDVQPYAKCVSASITTCSFDREKCESDKLESNTTDYLHKAGLPANFSESSLGGATHAPTDSDWNHADSMRASTFSSAEVNKTIANISDAVRSLVSFGQASKSSSMHQRHEYQSCAKWYFPDGAGSEFASVQHDQQPFVAAWKYAMVACRDKGGQ